MKGTPGFAKHLEDAAFHARNVEQSLRAARRRARTGEQAQLVEQAQGMAESLARWAERQAREVRIGDRVLSAAPRR